jgi:hypothetical protein
MKKNLVLFSNTYSILKLSPSDCVPSFVFESPFFSVTKDELELSIIVSSSYITGRYLNRTDNWKLMRLEGQFGFDETGVLLELISPLSNQEVGIIAVSTFNTDFLMVQMKDYENAKNILGQKFIISDQ